MKYVMSILLLVLLAGCGARESDFEEHNNEAKTGMTKMCNENGGTLATGIEVTYTTLGTEITAGYYCINTKNPTGSIR